MRRGASRGLLGPRPRTGACTAGPLVTRPAHVSEAGFKRADWTPPWHPICTTFSGENRKEDDMLTVRIILHPTDFSEHSQYAFGLACALARDYGAQLIVLHVATAPIVVYGEGLIPPDPEEVFAIAQDQLARLQPHANVRMTRR